MSGGSSGEDSVDEELLEGASICIQALITNMKRRNSVLRTKKRSLQKQLDRTLAWCEDLRQQNETLNSRLARGNPCLECEDLKSELKKLKTEMKKKKSELVSQETQTTEEDLREAAWTWHYKSNDDKDGEDDSWKVNAKEDDEAVSAPSLADQVKQAAESALIAQGMVLEETSGLYYDYKSGYYYDAERSLYYDGNTGTYYQYDAETNSYTTHSTISPEELNAQVELKRRAEELKEHKITFKRNAHTEDELENNAKKKNKSSDEGSSETQEEESIEESSIPCIRLVVTSAEEGGLPVGTLYIVTCKGGTIGSKGDHQVSLPDVGCSKLHARISFQLPDCTYFIRDLGSRNGTWVNNKRLSAPKTESEDFVIGHGTCIQIGKTKMICHVHPGRETCLECEPGQVKAPSGEGSSQVSSTGGRVSLNSQRIQEMQEIKRKYGLKGELNSVGAVSGPAEGYSDRANIRRKEQGIDTLYAKTEVSSVDQAISEENKGFKMLSKMGWSGGGLGKSTQGIVDPIQVEARQSKVGLGAEGVGPSQPPSRKDRQKADMWKKVAKRFDNAAVLDAFAASESEDEGEEKKE